MAPIQKEIVRVLKAAHKDLSMAELLDQVSVGTDMEVRAAVLPMISSERIELRPDRKLRLRTE
jgi:hypothetical protein